ncbi:hypothetical protein L1987_66219 [Smallanthus sonchifolius]|uniref:Uncharacterized protein n=1 Tax=Smallanthus sonchifolius TaxID=185202 RepID=A0ACB9BWH4_9ASTR|nr:hypothetical protein L1987_66219 [Smallanthus sonchifolius]
MDPPTTSAVVTGDHTPTTPTITRTLHLIQDDNHDPFSKIQAAKDIRRLTKTSQRLRRQFSDAVPPLVSMLRYPSLEAKSAALLALLNLAVQDEANKISIVDAGGLEPIIEGEEQSGNAKQMLADMVQVSMEQSLRHLQQRALFDSKEASPGLLCLVGELLRLRGLQGRNGFKMLQQMLHRK